MSVCNWRLCIEEMRSDVSFYKYVVNVHEVLEEIDECDSVGVAMGAYERKS